MVSMKMNPPPRQLSHEIDTLDRSILDLRPTWPKIERRIVDSIRKAFATKGGSVRSRWPRYAPSYAKKVGSSTPTLKRSGRMFNQATGRAQTKRRKLSLVYLVTADNLRVNEFGSKKHNIAARSVAQVSKRAEDQSMRDIDKHNEKRIKLFEAGRI
jgi:hypothetical protein